MSTPATTATEKPARPHVPQGRRVLWTGVIGSLVGIAPAALFFQRLFNIPEAVIPWAVLLLILWASVFPGAIVTHLWSNAVHERVEEFRQQLTGDSKSSRRPDRMPWMAGWLGVFERAFYAILIGLDVTGGATFIGVWVALKMAGGWQDWTKGSMHGQALFFAGLLGNTMSILLGVIAGLVIRSLLKAGTP